MHDVRESWMGKRFMQTAGQTSVMYFNVIESKEFIDTASASTSANL